MVKETLRVFIKFLPPFSYKYEDIALEFPDDRDKEITIKDLFGRLKMEFPSVYAEVCTSNDTVHEYVLCVINDRIMPHEELHNITLSNSDTITLGYAIGGGSDKWF